MIRKETYDVKGFLDKVKFARENDIEKMDFDGDLIKMFSQRYHVFLEKGTTCVECSIKGAFFAKERHENSKGYHMNLYAINEDGAEVLMTKDHIFPKSKGGKNHIENYQPMCEDCNKKKSDKVK